MKGFLFFGHFRHNSVQVISQTGDLKNGQLIEIYVSPIAVTDPEH